MRNNVLLGVAASCLIVLLAHAAPITYDEAFNRLYYDRLGVGKILTTYRFPNNHLPFTVLQSLIPSGLLDWDPWTIRAVGVLCGIGMIAALLAIAALRHSSPLVGLLAVAGSPLLVSYLFLSRGYTFSALFFFAAAALPAWRGHRHPHEPVALGALALALATWPLPTNVYAAPGWVAVVYVVWGARRALFGAGVYIAALALLFAPIVGQVRTQSKIPWAGRQHWWPWLEHVGAATSLIPVLLVLVVALAARRLVLDRDLAAPADQFAVTAAAMSVSWLVFIGLAHAAGQHLPFVRTAVPALWLAAAALVAVFPAERHGLVGLGLLAPAAVWGVVVWSQAVFDGNWQQIAAKSHDLPLYGTTPATIRDVSSVHADVVICALEDSVICRLVLPQLRRAGVTASVADSLPNDPSVPCALGSRRPPPPWRVSVYRRGKLLGVLCA